MFHKLLSKVVFLVQKRMLKGLKKSQNHQDDSQIDTDRPQVNQNKIKEEEMKEQEAQEEDGTGRAIQLVQDRQKNKIMEQCMRLFLSGEATRLQNKLKDLKQLGKEVKIPKIENVKKGKFQYQIDFDEGDLPKKKKQNKRARPIMASNRVQDYCIYCPDNEELRLISASNYVYLALPKRKTFKNYAHLIIAPVDHEQTMVGLNQNILTQINNFKKCLIQAFDHINLHVVFFEQFSSNNSHIYIECVAMNLKKGQDLPFFFKQALQSIEGNWTTHRNIIRIEKQKGGLQKQIPRPIKYFYIDFVLGYGYAHVIEDEKNWKRDFCYEILATALGLPMHAIKSTEEYTEEQLEEKRIQFLKLWKAYDWTNLL